MLPGDFTMFEGHGHPLVIFIAPPSLVDLWHMIALSFEVFFVIIDCHNILPWVFFA
jgi:hypothetical protein